MACVDAHARTLGVQAPLKDLRVENKRVGFMLCDVTTLQVCSELADCQYVAHGDAVTADFVLNLKSIYYDIKTRIMSAAG